MFSLIRYVLQPVFKNHISALNRMKNFDIEGCVFLDDKYSPF